MSIWQLIANLYGASNQQNRDEVSNIAFRKADKKSNKSSLKGFLANGSDSGLPGQFLNKMIFTKFHFCFPAYFAVSLTFPQIGQSCWVLWRFWKSGLSLYSATKLTGAAICKALSFRCNSLVTYILYRLPGFAHYAVRKAVVHAVANYLRIIFMENFNFLQIFPALRLRKRDLYSATPQPRRSPQVWQNLAPSHHHKLRMFQRCWEMGEKIAKYLIFHRDFCK